MATSVKEQTSEQYKKLIETLKPRNTKVKVRIGVQGDGANAPHGSDGETVGEIAVKHELGLGVPERSFLRAWVDQNRGRIEGEVRQVALRIFQGAIPVSQAAELLGARYVGEIQQFIADNKVQPPSSPATNALKGSSVTLIDTGVLRSSISYVVENASGGAGKAQRAAVQASKKREQKVKARTKKLSRLAKVGSRSAKKAARLGKRSIRASKRTVKAVRRELRQRVRRVKRVIRAYNRGRR